MNRRRNFERQHDNIGKENKRKESAVLDRTNYINLRGGYLPQKSHIGGGETRRSKRNLQKGTQRTLARVFVGGRNAMGYDIRSGSPGGRTVEDEGAP